MAAEFKKLLSITLKHNYYQSGRTNDFDFVYDKSSHNLFSKRKLVSKIVNGALTVFARTEPNNFDFSDKTVTAGLVLTNPYFYNFTEKVLEQGIPFYHNSNSQDSLSQPFPVTVVSQRFEHKISKIKRPVSLELNSNGALIESILISQDQKIDSFNFLLPYQDTGNIEVAERYSNETITQNYYSTDQLAKLSISALISIKLANNFLTNPPDFEITFSAKKQTLNYYLVARNYSSGDFSDLRVTGVDNFNTTIPVTIDFNKITASSFTSKHLSKEMLGVDGEARVVLFHSNSPVLRHERSKLDIQLSKDGETLIPKLPLSGPEKITADMIIHLSKPKT